MMPKKRKETSLMARSIATGRNLLSGSPVTVNFNRKKDKPIKGEINMKEDIIVLLTIFIGIVLMLLICISEVVK